MSKTLLIIQSHADHKNLVDLCWQSNQIPGWPVLGITPEDAIHAWHPDVYHCAMIGKAGYLQPDVIKRWVATWELVISYEKFAIFDDFCMIESDSLFLRPPPLHPGGLFTNHAVGKIGGASKATRGFHCPWWLSRSAAKIIVEEGKKLISEGEFELCSPDMFLGLITDRRPEIPVHQTKTWSCNGNDLQNRRDQAERAIKEGIWHLHGVRTQEEIEWVKGLVK